jgi:hypothetical protein
MKFVIPTRPLIALRKVTVAGGELYSQSCSEHEIGAWQDSGASRLFEIISLYPH